MDSQVEVAAIGGAVLLAAAFLPWVFRRAEMREKRVRPAALDLWKWIKETDNGLRQGNPPFPRSDRGDELVSIVGVKSLRTLFVTWFKARTNHALMLGKGHEDYPVECVRRDAAIWRPGGDLLDQALRQMIGGRRWPTVAEWWRVRRLHRRASGK